MSYRVFGSSCFIYFWGFCGWIVLGFVFRYVRVYIVVLGMDDGDLNWVFINWSIFYEFILGIVV